MLTVDKIHTYYGDSHILEGVSMEVKENCIVGLSGRNGAGKTTTIYSLIGFIPIRQGRIEFQAVDITNLPSNKVSRLGIGLVPQGRRIFNSLSVKENLTLAARNVDQSEQEWNLNKIFCLFPILKERLNCRAKILSGGESQILAICRALMTNPKLLLMDEPTEGLAPLIVKEILRVILMLKEENGSSILLAEQHFQKIKDIVDYVYVLTKGKVVFESRPDDLINNEEVKAKYLGLGI